MRDRHAVPVDRVAARVIRPLPGAVGNDLVTVKVEVDPCLAAAPLGAAHDSAPEGAGLGQVVDGKGEVERGQAHGAPHSAFSAFLQGPSARRFGPCAIRQQKSPRDASAQPLPPDAALCPRRSAPRAGGCRTELLDPVHCVHSFSLDRINLNG